MTIANISAAPGEIAKGFWEVAEAYDNSAIEIPIAIVNGKKEGPVVWIQNAVHGDEYVGIGAIHEFMRSVNPEILAGAVVVLPWINPLAFRNGARMAPQDGMDMNRVYPGKPIDEAMHLFAHTEIVVHKLFSEIQRVADVILDLHDGGWMGQMSAYIQYFATGKEVDRRSRDIAMASGMDIIWESPGGFVEKKAPGSIGTASTPMGIPTLTIEIGGEGRLKRHWVARMYRAVDNILRHLDVVPGEPEPHGWSEKLYVRQGNWLRPERGGVYVSHVEAGQQVEQDALIAEVRDPFGETIEQLRAPVGGVVIGMRTYGTIASGQYAGNVAEVVQSLD
jgi:hypothetical protein